MGQNRRLINDRDIINQVMELAYLTNNWQKSDVREEVDNFHKLEDAAKNFHNMLKRYKQQQGLS